MITRRYRLLGVAIILVVGFTLLLTQRPYDTREWIKKAGRLSETTPNNETAPEDVKPPPPPEPTDILPTNDNIDWNKFAYIQYVTDGDYLCNSVMIFESLYMLGSRAKRVMMYPKEMLKDPKAAKGTNAEQRLLIRARENYGVELMPIEIQHRKGSDTPWADSYTKLLAFQQTQFKRVLVVDSDSVILKSLDDLFLMPPCPVAMPRAYWLYDEDPPKQMLSSQLILLQPSHTEFERIMERVGESAEDDYDMEILNQLYLDTATVLPHRPYELLTSEYRKKNHTRYLGTDREDWEPVRVFNEARFLHFSDDPVPKPWIEMSDKVRQKYQPECPDDKVRCPSRDLWNGFYNEFARRRKRVCGQ